MANFDDRHIPAEPSLRDVEYGLDGGIVTTATNNTTYDDLIVTVEDKKTMKETVINETEEAIKDMTKDINDSRDMSKDERKSLKKFFIKKLNKLKSTYIKRVEEEEYDLGDIEEELDETLSKLKDVLNDLLDDCDYYYGGGKSNSWDKSWNKWDYSQSKLSDCEDKWPKKDYSKLDDKKETNDYSKDLEEVKSDVVKRIMVDVESLNAFLAESDGKKENIAVITADNREYKDIENTIFKIALVPAEVKLRQGAYTEADGKKIADALACVNAVKCGWIHTHPFGEHSTFFSGRDDSTTKEMCVLPDDYCIAIVVGCSYNESKNYMTTEGKVVKEYDLRYSLGRVIYRKAEIPKNEYDAKTDKIKSTPELMLVKYDMDVMLVDKNGKEIDIKALPVHNPETYTRSTTQPSTQSLYSNNCDLYD